MARRRKFTSSNQAGGRPGQGPSTRAMKRAVLLLILSSCLAGCDWVLLEFRGQLKQLPKHAQWEDRPSGKMLVFSEPILTLANLKELAVAPTPAPGGLLAIRYRYHADKPGGAGESAMLLVMEDHKLRGVIFPSVMLDMLGQRNLEALLRMAGGDSSPAAGVRDLEKAQVVRAVFGANLPADDRQLTLTFEPIDPGNRMLKLEFDEGKKSGRYSTLRLTIGKPGQPLDADAK